MLIVITGSGVVVLNTTASRILASRDSHHSSMLTVPSLCVSCLEPSGHFSYSVRKSGILHYALHADSVKVILPKISSQVCSFYSSHHHSQREDTHHRSHRLLNPSFLLLALQKQSTHRKAFQLDTVSSLPPVMVHVATWVVTAALLQHSSLEVRPCECGLSCSKVCPETQAPCCWHWTNLVKEV